MHRMVWRYGPGGLTLTPRQRPTSQTKPDPNGWGGRRQTPPGRAESHIAYPQHKSPTRVRGGACGTASVLASAGVGLAGGAYGSPCSRRTLLSQGRAAERAAMLARISRDKQHWAVAYLRD